MGRRVRCVAPAAGWASTRTQDGDVVLDPLETSAFRRCTFFHLFPRKVSVIPSRPARGLVQLCLTFSHQVREIRRKETGRELSYMLVAK